MMRRPIRMLVAASCVAAGVALCGAAIVRVSRAVLAEIDVMAPAPVARSNPLAPATRTVIQFSPSAPPEIPTTVAPEAPPP